MEAQQKTTHALAAELRAVAAKLESQSDIPCPSGTLYLWPDTKESFVALAKVLPKPLIKSVTDGSYPTVTLRNDGGAVLRVDLTINRDRVCRKVQEERWDCEPFFEHGEIEELSRA